MRTKVTAEYIIGYKDEEFIIYKNGEMLYEDDRILEVGNKVKGSWDQEMNLGQAVISPGFIDLDALGDIDHALIYAEQPHPEKLFWSKEYFLKGPKEAMTPEEEGFKSLYAYSQLISHGVTTAMPITCVYYKKAGETEEEIEAAAGYARQLGLRVYLGPSYISAMHVYDPETGEEPVLYMEEEGWKGLKRAKRFAEKYAGCKDDLVHPVMVPERIELQTEDILLETKRFANEHGLLMRLHAAQGKYEYRFISGKYGMSTVQYLDSIGLLDEKTLIPHAIYASGYSGLEDKSDDDLNLLKKRNVSVIHCPLVYSRSGQALESFGRYRRMGMNLCMGTDTFPPDPLENIRIGSAMSRHIDGDRPESFYKEFFEAATLGGAKALGRDDLGRLAPGAKADFIAIDLSGFAMGTIDDPIRTICMCASGRDVKLSVINGRTVLRDGKIPGLDYDVLKEKAQAYYEKLKHSFIERSGITDKEPELFYPNSYPIVKEDSDV